MPFGCHRPWAFRCSLMPTEGLAFSRLSELMKRSERLRQHETLSRESFWQSYLDLLLCIALHCFALF